jgi:hypothetical protein
LAITGVPLASISKINNWRTTTGYICQRASSETWLASGEKASSPRPPARYRNGFIRNRPSLGVRESAWSGTVQRVKAAMQAAER